MYFLIAGFFIQSIQENAGKCKQFFRRSCPFSHILMGTCLLWGYLQKVHYLREVWKMGSGKWCNQLFCFTKIHFNKGEKRMKFLLNLNRRTIHNAASWDGRCRLTQISEDNKKIFPSYQAAKDYLPSGNRPTHPCPFCLGADYEISKEKDKWIRILKGTRL